MGVPGKSSSPRPAISAANAVGGLKDGIKDRLVDLKDKGVNTAGSGRAKAKRSSVGHRADRLRGRVHHRQNPHSEVIRGNSCPAGRGDD